jgi:hypothetical protein
MVDLAAQRKAEADQLLARGQPAPAGGRFGGQPRPASSRGLLLVPDHPVLLALRDQSQPPDRRRGQEAGQRTAQQAKLQAEQFLEQAQRARQEGALDMSLVHIEQGLQAMPDHAALLALKQDGSGRTGRTPAPAGHRPPSPNSRAAANRSRAAESRGGGAAESRGRAAPAESRRVPGPGARLPARSRLRSQPAANRARLAAGLPIIPDCWRCARKSASSCARPRPRRRSSRRSRRRLDDAARLAALLKQCEAHLNANRLTLGQGGQRGRLLRRGRSGGIAATARRRRDSTALPTATPTRWRRCRNGEISRQPGRRSTG